MFQRDETICIDVQSSTKMINIGTNASGLQPTMSKEPSIIEEV